jgi:hypothetical protein
VEASQSKIDKRDSVKRDWAMVAASGAEQYDQQRCSPTYASSKIPKAEARPRLHKLPYDVMLKRFAGYRRFFKTLKIHMS